MGERHKGKERKKKDLLFIATTMLPIPLQECTAIHVSMMWFKGVWLVCSAGCSEHTVGTFLCMYPREHVQKQLQGPSPGT